MRKAGALWRPPADLRGYSQFGEDRWMWEHLFWRQINGTFVEMGAIDGIAISNSALYGKHLGWTGILIEALPSQLHSLARNRPESICINTAVCSNFSTVHYVEHYANPGVSGALAGSGGVRRRRRLAEVVFGRATLQEFWSSWRPAFEMAFMRCSPMAPALMPRRSWLSHACLSSTCSTGLASTTSTF